MKKLISYRQAKIAIDREKMQGKKIIFKTGCFDVLHLGHIKSLQNAKKKADILLVGVGADYTLRGLKGEGKPIFPEKIRANAIAALECVDYVVILKEPLIGRIDHEKIISIIKPHYYYLPNDDKALHEKKKIAKKYGLKIKYQSFLVKNSKDNKVISSTYILRNKDE